MKLLRMFIAAILLCLGASTVGIAYADPMTDDEINDTAFIATLDMFNVPYDSKTEAISTAKALCLWYAVNDTFFAMGAMQLMKENPSFTTADAGHFAGAATSVYCPKYGPKGG